MVNFNLRLRENVFGEWKNEYIDYAKLKRLVKKQEQLQSASRYFDTENSATPSNYGTMMAKNRITGVRRSRSTSFLHTLAAKAVDASEFQGLVSFPQSDPFEDALEAEYEKVEHAYKTHVAHGRASNCAHDFYLVVAVIADFFLCFAWTLSLIPHRGSSQEFLLYLQPFTMVAELFRRTMWSFFCLENEHLRNTHGFRQVDLIPLHCEQIGSVGNGADAEQKPLDPLGGWALLTNILLLTLAVVALSVAAIVIEK
uniref:SPX domain-containing protein n=1 Tax=Globisporangium ultimum (strain ATCC 200006 / CBS 805.95 / DAOM BR144) TaxID=431595 RepID=K3WSV8_GLOUD